jgi:hypothetical protein
VVAYGRPMRRILGVVAWGALGAVVAAALISGAFVVAGSRLTQPASAVRVVTSTPLRANTPDHHEHDTNSTDDTTPTSAPTPAPATSSVPTTVLPASIVPVPTPSKDDGVERGDD